MIGLIKFRRQTIKITVQLLMEKLTALGGQPQFRFLGLDDLKYFYHPKDIPEYENIDLNTRLNALRQSPFIVRPVN